MATNEKLSASDTPATSLRSGRPFILNLPDEVLGMIVSECEDTDLKNLRLTCNALCAVSTQPFGRAFFARCHFVFTRPSMEVLVNITAHRIFGPCLQAISFGSCRLSEVLLLVKSNPEMAKLYQDQQRFVCGGHHGSMLSRALGNLNACSNTSVSLGIYDDIDEANTGRKKRYKHADRGSYGNCLPQNLNVIGTLRALVDAQVQSNFPLNALHLDLSYPLDSLVALADADADQTLEKLILSDSGDIKPHLNINISLVYPDCTEGTGTMRILSDGPNLELSKFSIEDDHTLEPHIQLNSDICHPLRNVLFTTPFKYISLRDTFVELTRLSEFLEGSKESLKRLELSGIKIWSSEDGLLESGLLVPIFACLLRDKLDLETLIMNDVQLEETQIKFIDGKITLHGREAVHAELNALIAFAKNSGFR